MFLFNSTQIQSHFLKNLELWFSSLTYIDGSNATRYVVARKVIATALEENNQSPLPLLRNTTDHKAIVSLQPDSI